MSRIGILGASGVVGRCLIPKLLKQAHDIHYAKDIFDEASLIAAFQDCEVVINLATAIPKPGQTWDLNDRIRREGTATLIKVCQHLGIQRFIQQSIAMLYHQPGATWLDESAEFYPNAITQSAADMEILIENSNLDYIILRGGLLYGPSTGREDTWRKQAQTHALTLPKNKHDYLSLIHVEDLAEAFALAVSTPYSKLAVNIVDDEPVTYEALYHFIAKQEQALPPTEVSTIAPYAFRVRNHFAKEILGWQPHFKNYQEGLTQPDKDPSTILPQKLLSLY